MGVAPGSSSPAGEMSGGVMMAGVRPGMPPCMRTAYPSAKACIALQDTYGGSDACAAPLTHFNHQTLSSLFLAS